MGVFARFRRKSKDTEAASTAEAQAATLTAEPEAEGSSPETSGTSETADTSAAADTTAPEESTEAAGTPEPAAAEPVEIPKQQSAEEAADNGAGDSARK
ncbi:hypothetical protein ACFRAI_45295 [Streptomyces sp. NPDC056637]|uniref:hypothetical protein n=1 Tax=unclassified Streptomyces TaxID=2593676 RepID=UPI003644D11E